VGRLIASSLFLLFSAGNLQEIYSERAGREPRFIK